MKLKYNKLATLAVTLITFGLLAGGANGAVIIVIAESGGDVEFSVTGTLVSSALTNEGSWNSSEGQTEWENSNPSQNDALVIFGESNSRYSITGVTDTGVLNTSHASIGSGVVTNGTGIAIGTSLFGGGTSLVLGDSLSAEGYVYNYTVSFTGRVLSDFGLADGQTRTVTFYDGIGSQESIQWSVVPEPSSFLLLGLGALGVVARRRRIT